MSIKNHPADILTIPTIDISFESWEGSEEVEEENKNEKNDNQNRYNILDKRNNMEMKMFSYSSVSSDGMMANKKIRRLEREKHRQWQDWMEQRNRQRNEGKETHKEKRKTSRMISIHLGWFLFSSCLKQLIFFSLYTLLFIDKECNCLQYPILSRFQWSYWSVSCSFRFFQSTSSRKGFLANPSLKMFFLSRQLRSSPFSSRFILFHCPLDKMMTGALDIFM